MNLTGHDFQPFACGKQMRLAFDLKCQFAGQDVEELANPTVEMTRFRGLRWHAFVDDAHLRLSHQVPAIATGAPGIMLCSMATDFFHPCRFQPLIEIVSAYTNDPGSKVREIKKYVTVSDCSSPANRAPDFAPACRKRFRQAGRDLCNGTVPLIGGPLDRKSVWRGFAGDVGQWVLLGFGAWAIEARESGAYVGQIGLNFPEHFPERELGWLVWQEFEGRGYAMEAALRAREFAFDDLGWPTAVSYIAPENARSIKLAERMGAAVDPNAATPDGDVCLVYRHSAGN